MTRKSKKIAPHFYGLLDVSSLEANPVEVAETGKVRMGLILEVIGKALENYPEALETNLEQEKLKIAANCHSSRELKEELLKVEIRRMGFGYKFGAFKKDSHDDLVMALALACWRERLGQKSNTPNVRLPGF